MPLGAAMILLWVGLVVVAADSVSTIQPTYKAEINDTLIDMIMEMKVELRYTKEQLQDVETRLRASEETVEGQKLVIRELTEKQSEQASAVGVVGGQVEELRRDREASRVSFSAALGDGYYGPFNVATPLVFKVIFTNVGSAYNINTGVFTAPVRGVYHFVLFVLGDASGSTATGASIQHNGEHVVIAYGHQVNPSYDKPANGVSLLLEVGDVVQVKLYPKAWVRDNVLYRHTTFSGHLLFTM